VILTEGQKIGASEANLLAKLGIKPFSYGLSLSQVYDDGSVYSYKVLDKTEEDIIRAFHSGVRNIASLGLRIGYPTAASIPHSIARGYKNVLAVSLATDYTFEKAQKIKDYLANPSAFAAVAPTPAAESAPVPDKKGGGGGGGGKPKPVEVEKEASDEDMGFGLFD